MPRLTKTAQLRNSSKHPSATRRKTDVFNDVEVDTLGIIAEYAVGSFLGRPIDWAIRPRGDNGVDIVLQDGRTAAVKYNHRWKGYLMVESRDEDTDSSLSDLTTDILILSHGRCIKKQDGSWACLCRDDMYGKKGVVVAIAGWISKEEFMSKRAFADWGIGGRWYVSTEQLHPITELMGLASRSNRLV